MINLTWKCIWSPGVTGCLKRALSIAATTTGATATKVTFNNFGQITGTAVLAAADLPVATASAVGAVSVHGVAGFFGLMLVPFSNADATFLGQLTGAAIIFAWVFGTSFVVWLVLKKTMGIRVSEEEEYLGMDIADCGIDAYPEFVTVKGS